MSELSEKEKEEYLKNKDKLEKAIQKEEKLKKELQELEDKQERELTLKIKKIKLKLLTKILDRWETRKCYCCKEPATRMAHGIMLPDGVFFLCAICHYFLVEQEDTE